MPRMSRTHQTRSDLAAPYFDNIILTFYNFFHMVEQDTRSRVKEQGGLASLNVDGWRRITSKWDSSFRLLVYKARALSLEDRQQESEELLEGIGSFKSEEAKTVARHVAIIYGLTNEALNRAIESFAPCAGPENIPLGRTPNQVRPRRN